MLTFTLRPHPLVRIGLAVTLSLILSLGMIGLGAQDVAATSPVSTIESNAEEAAGTSELTRIILATTDEPLTTSHIRFIEENVVLPGD